MNKYRAWDKENKKMISWKRLLNGHNLRNVFMRTEMCGLILMQSSEFIDEENSDDIWEFDLLEVESPKGKFIAKVVKEYGTFGIVAVKGRIVDYFWDHWNDDFMPLIDIYWNENGDDGCLPGTKRLGSSLENPELLK